MGNRGMIRVVVNGEGRTLEEGMTVEALLSILEMPAGRLAVERNRRVVPRERYAREPVEEGDRIEIVTLVGGG